MLPFLILLAFILYLAIPKETEEETMDEEDFIDEMLLLWDEEEDEY